MNFFSILAVSEPSSLWATLIEWVHSWVGGGYGWTILVLIVLLKLVLSPLDYLIKHSTKKQTLVQQKLAPEMAKLQKKYGDNQQMIQTQQQALYKREKFNVFGSCIIMLVNLVVTMVIFFTLFSSLRTLSSYQAIEQYDSLNNAYITCVTSSEHYGSLEDYQQYAQKIVDQGIDSLTEADRLKWDKAQESAKEAVVEVWSIKADNWLWVKNIWVIDGHKSPMPTLSALSDMASQSKIKEYTQYVDDIKNNAVATLNYNNIASMVESTTGEWNGYYILAILAIALSTLSQFINELTTKHKNKNAQNIVDQANPQTKSSWIMKLLLPLTMATFVFTTNAAFGIYVVTNSIISMITGLLINLIINKVFAKKQAEVDEFLLKEAQRIAKKQAKGEN